MANDVNDDDDDDQFIIVKRTLKFKKLKQLRRLKDRNYFNHIIILIQKEKNTKVK